MNTYSSALNVFRSLPKQTQERLIAEERAPIVYSLDAVILSFLRKHDVFIEPPTQGPGVDVSDRLLFAVSGPLAMANAGIKNQSKAANQAEWTSWKQWALSHQDFKEFKQKAEARAEKCNSEFNLWYNSQEAKDIISAQKKEQKRDSRSLLFACFLIVLSPFIVSVFIMAGDDLNKRFFAPGAPVPQLKNDG